MCQLDKMKWETAYNSLKLANESICEMIVIIYKLINYNLKL